MRQPTSMPVWHAGLEAFCFIGSGGAAILLLSHALVLTLLWQLLFLVVYPLGMLWFIVRWRRSAGRWWRIVGGEALLLLLCNMLSVTCTLLISGGLLIVVGTAVPHDRGFTTAFFWLSFAFLATFRIGRYLWQSWDRLRRRSLLWSLTHAHLTVVALGALLLVSIVLGLNLFVNAAFVHTLIPVTLSLLGFSVLIVVTLLPPSALFSALVARGTTRRLAVLGVAAAELRAGNFARRVTISGADEVAQLQQDFNAMAATLETTMRDLQTERDTVATLLRSQRELLADVAHDLRTPMATLRSSVESLGMAVAQQPQDHAVVPSLPHDLAVIHAAVLQLQRQLDDLFALARADLGKLALHCVPTDLTQLMAHIVAVDAPLAHRAYQVELVLLPATEQLAAWALIDAQRMEQALQNLVHNALRHTPPGGIVALNVEAEDSMLAVHVADTGEGIAPDKLTTIWERFTQGTIQQGEHAGLGLALVKEWTEAMGGTVAVQSHPGAGSRFTLRVPAVSMGAIVQQNRDNVATLEGPI